MSSNNFIPIENNLDTIQSSNVFKYSVDPNRFEHNNKCRHQLGLIGGTDVSHIKGNLVDLETDLRGQTRRTTKCPTKLYQSPCPKGDMNNCQPGNINIMGDPSQTQRNVNTQMLHLPSCQMIRYRPTPIPPELNFNHSVYRNNVAPHNNQQ